MQTQQKKYTRKKQIRCGIRAVVVCLLVAILFGLHRWLVRNDATVSDQAIVYLTAVLLFISFMQWDVTAVQNDAIERQLDQVEFQQRAWLAASPLTIGVLCPGAYDAQQRVDHGDWGVEVKNTGQTPAIVLQSLLEPNLETANYDKQAAIAKTEAHARMTNKRRTVIAAGEVMTFRLREDGQEHVWHENNCKVVRDGDTDLACLFGAFIYEDVFGHEHKTLCSYRYNRHTDQLFCNFDDGEMT